jgi:hypothetical protein
MGSIPVEVETGWIVAGKDAADPRLVSAEG